MTVLSLVPYNWEYNDPSFYSKLVGRYIYGVLIFIGLYKAVLFSNSKGLLVEYF